MKQFSYLLEPNTTKQRGRSELTAQAFRPAQLAARWGVSVGHIHNLIRKGDLHAFRIGTLYRISAIEVERIEGCGSSDTEGNGLPPTKTGTQAKSGGAPWVPPTVPQPRGGSVTSRLKHLERDCLDATLFGDTELWDFKCFRGDRTDVSEAEIKQEIHSAFMQRKMKRASVSADAPRPGVPSQNVREFVKRDGNRRLRPN